MEGRGELQKRQFLLFNTDFEAIFFICLLLRFFIIIAATSELSPLISIVLIFFVFLSNKAESVHILRDGVSFVFAYLKKMIILEHPVYRNQVAETLILRTQPFRFQPNWIFSLLLCFRITLYGRRRNAVIPYRTQREQEQQNQVENPLNLYGLAGKNKMLFDIIRFIYLYASYRRVHKHSPASSSSSYPQPNRINHKVMLK